MNCPLFVAELFDHIAVKDIEHVCTRKSRIFSFCEGLSGFTRFFNVFSALHFTPLEEACGVCLGRSG